MSLMVKNPPANAGDIRDASSVPGYGRSPGGGHGNLLQYSCLENPMDRGAWQAPVHRFTKSWTPLRQVSMHAYICPLSLKSPSHPPTPPHPFKWSQSTRLSSQCHTATSLQLPILHKVMYMFLCYSLNASYPLLPQLSTSLFSAFLFRPCK